MPFHNLVENAYRYNTMKTDKKVIFMARKGFMVYRRFDMSVKYIGYSRANIDYVSQATTDKVHHYSKNKSSYLSSVSPFGCSLVALLS